MINLEAPVFFFCAASLHPKQTLLLGRVEPRRFRAGPLGVCDPTPVL